MYKSLGISLALATLLTINAVASLAAAALWRLIEKPMRSCSARTRAEVLFAMRIGPPAVALISVAALLIPSYIAYEPYSTNEFVSKKLGALAILSAIGVALALSRGFRSWLATRSLLRKWLNSATPIKLPEIDVPTFRISHPFPIIAVVGMFRPRLFIAERVIESLSQEEMVAAIAHEYGHLAARDNLKRSLLRACRDALMIAPCCRSIDRAWAETAECAADEHAAHKSPATALDLASALVKIAKMVPAGSHAAMPVAAFLVGNEETRGVNARIGRLLEIASTAHHRRVGNPVLTKLIISTAICFSLVVTVLVANNTQILLTVHSL